MTEDGKELTSRAGAELDVTREPTIPEQTTRIVVRFGTDLHSPWHLLAVVSDPAVGYQTMCGREIESYTGPEFSRHTLEVLPNPRGRKSPKGPLCDAGCWK